MPRFTQILRNGAMAGLALISFSVSSAALAWTGPSQAAPDGNVAAPINVGTIDQIKNAGLSLNALAVFGNAIIAGTTNYLNFGMTAGSDGYGIRNSSGTLEFKNSGGSWQNLQTIINNYITLASPWTASGSNIYRSSGNVGIGTSNPAQKLQVNGYTQATGFCIGSSCITSWSAAGGAACGARAHMEVYTVSGAYCSCGSGPYELFLYQCRNGSATMVQQIWSCTSCGN